MIFTAFLYEEAPNGKVESMCIRGLRIYADAHDGKVYHYRDKSGLECDAIIVLRD